MLHPKGSLVIDSAQGSTADSAGAPAGGLVLPGILGPADLRALSPAQLTQLASEIRSFLVASVAQTGGHLGPNLGVVELTIAMHRVFDSPRDTIVFDTGHQSYVHKLLTGRHDFSGLRRRGGLSGYPSRAESPHDVVENSHASASLSWADGIAKARRLTGDTSHVVAVIGDGALTGGMAWEALNNIACDKDLRLVIVVNDNERSYATTTGGLADYLATLRMTPGYERVLDWGKATLARTPVVGPAMYDTLHGMKKGLKDIVAPQGMFEDLGLKYLGPVDGHDEEAVESALRKARSYGGPVLVHVLTQKGRGYAPARSDEADQFHAVGKINPETGLPLEVVGRSWTDELSEELCAIGAERDDVVALTAAMMIPVGLRPFAELYPDRVFDVGIAEQHAVTMAAGLAYGGLHPVVAIYATFLNRAFDQLLMDCALHRAGVTFVLDRAGITGPDGASHHGMWDLSLAGVVPGLRVAAPRDGLGVRALLREAVAVTDGPTVVRFPRGEVGDPLPAVGRRGSVDVLLAPSREHVDLTVVAVGAMAPTGVAVAEKLEALGLSVLVLDPRWVLPVAGDLVAACRGAVAVAVLEDNVVSGGVGSAVTAALRADGQEQPVHLYGLPPRFLPQGTRDQVLDDAGLSTDAVVSALTTALVAPAT